jgi:hypothetical protein
MREGRLVVFDFAFVELLPSNDKAKKSPADKRQFRYRALANGRKFATMSAMEKQNFRGTVLRIEPNGFGIIQFDVPIGPSANTHGVFSTTLGSTAPYKELKPGVHVTGQAKPEADARKLATVESLSIVLP